MRTLNSWCLVAWLLGCWSATIAQTTDYTFSDAPAPKDTTRFVPPRYGDRLGDPFSMPRRYAPLLGLGLPSGISLDRRLDSTGNYIELRETLGDFYFRPPSRISLDDYRDLRSAEIDREYWRTLQSGETDESGLATNRLFKPIKLESKMLNRFLGGDEIDIQPNGAVTLDFGGQWTRIDNPQIPIRQQRMGGFRFDQRIQLGLLGKIGEKIQMNVNWDTKSTFQFENRFNQGYSGYEEDIIQQVQFGNVSMPVNNSLISGAQNLFGVGTRLRFGKLWLSAVVANQRGTVENLEIRNGSQTQFFEFPASEYEENRHFFLSQFFRNNFENALRTLPTIASGVIVTRVEVYVTNRNNDTQTLRNVGAFMDMGEGSPYRDRLNGRGGPAANNANELFQFLLEDTRLRTPDEISAVLGNDPRYQLQKGTDWELLRGSRKLNDNEFTFHPQLGYISLLQPLRNDEILAVSYEYTYKGQRYRVGELTENYQDFTDEAVIFLKLLSHSTIRTQLPAWDLMMKNIYSLQAMQIQQKNFQLRIVYRDDRSGVDNPSLHEGQQLKDIPLVQVFEIDRLNQSNDPQPDGNFDFVDGITIDTRTGRIMFPVLEPFGSHLRQKFSPTEEIQLIRKYVYDTLYRGTQADARLFTNKNKFFLKGSYEGSSSNEIRLPGINIAPGSVIVTAGNTPLVEGVDYTVDYQMGRVTILNEAILNSGKPVKVDYERADMFNFQQRSFMGLDMEYRFDEDTKMTATFLHLNERPTITRVTMGQEPVRNTLMGASISTRKNSRQLTRWIDKIPGLDTKEESRITFDGEFAYLIPGRNRLIGKDGGTAFIDDFESAEIPYELGRQPQQWHLGSTPPPLLLNTVQDPLAYGYNRAKIAWYAVDNTAFFNLGLGQNPPNNISDADRQNHYTRLIPFNEIQQGLDQQQINTPEVTFDVAYFPQERGQYNYNPNLGTDGLLPGNPENNFGAITRGINYNVDFDNINIQYIEFWVLDPFIDGENGQIVTKTPQGLVTRQNNTTGGFLYFNLGNVSEDVIPDSRHGFENGMPVSNDTTELRRKTALTSWGRVTRQQYLTNAFDAAEGARERQDVGLDGLNDEEEREFFSEYLSRLNPTARAFVQNDPSGDNFQYYLGDRLDQEDAKILDRYKRFNGLEGNSPENAGTQSSTTFPDNEDLNRDNTISDVESYYEYKIEMRPNRMQPGQNRYIVNQTQVNTPSGDQVTWYQFRIPIREFTRAVGGIEGFKSIRFIRMYMTGWRQPAVLRFSNFKFVGGQWRPYFKGLRQPGFNLPLEPYDPVFTVTSVNIIENGTTNGSNTPYVVPPGFQRDVDITSITRARLNEQSIQMCVEDLQNSDARAVFKNINFDFLNYKRVKMFIHAESDDSEDGEMTAFLRLGTDFEENYYEVEVPLVMTPRGSTDPRVIWPEENEIDIAFEDLVGTKVERNRNGLSLGVPYSRTVGRYRVTVVGNPDLSTVLTAMLGIRNPNTADQRSRSVCVWMNELRIAGFDSEGGWAANARLNAQLADWATVNASMRYSTIGFGGIQDRISQRERQTSLYYDISTNMQLDKIFLNRLGISLPMFASIERSIVTPQFNPLDPDVELQTALSTIADPDARRNYERLVREETTRRSLNFTNVRKTKINPEAKTHLWDIENFAFTWAYSEERSQNVTTATYENRQTHLGLVYAYQFADNTWQPFKDNELLNAPYLRWLRDFNINPTPASLAVTGDVRRRFTKTQLRTFDLSTRGILPQYEKAFLFDRSYNLQWNFTKSLSADYSAVANGIIDEPAGAIGRSERDSILTNLARLGRMKFFDQRVNFNYKIPLDKFPALDWINADARYTGSYTWTAGAFGLADSLGHHIRNSQNITLNGQLNLQKLYDKSPALKSLNRPQRAGVPRRPPPYKPEKRKRLQFKIKLTQVKTKRAGSKRDIKVRRRKVKTLDISRRIPDSLIVLDTVEWNPELFEDIEEKFDRKKTKQDRKRERLQAKLKELEQKQRERATQEAPNNGAAQAALKALLSLKKININYSENGSTSLPGFLPTPRFLGFDDQWESPGVPFLLGSQNRAEIDKFKTNGWLSQSEIQSNPLDQMRNQTLSMQATIEPVRGFRIQVEARRNNGSNYSEVIRFSDGAYQSETPVRSGNYSISYFAMFTTLAADDRFDDSPLFDDFIRNRQLVKDRLDALNPNGEYQLSSQDVIIPAFLAAYTGRSPERQRTFPQIPLPNWKVNFSGLKDIGGLDEIFTSLTLTHGYSSQYSVGSYTSSLLYDANFLNPNVSIFDLPLPLTDPETALLTPLFILNQVSIDERFSPLIGINARTTGDLTFRVDVGRQRNLMLNLSNAQVTETKGTDLTLDFGFTKKGVKLPFSNGIVLENDLVFRTAMTIRDTKTVQRRVDEDGLQNSTVTAGNLNFQFRPTLSYQVNTRLNLTGYFERGINQPRISNAFRRTNTAFGMQMRFNLAE
ncbi:MAG: cell surface protein SprA [Bernardetiaceae bacterium]